MYSAYLTLRLGRRLRLRRRLRHHRRLAGRLPILLHRSNLRRSERLIRIQFCQKVRRKLVLGCQLGGVGELGLCRITARS